jgi:hypothetical protein
MEEKLLERKLVQAVKGMGGLALKLSCPSSIGWPDRILLFPCGVVAFVEIKRMGCKPREIQLYRHRQLRDLGFRVYVLDNGAQVNDLLTRVSGG